jgi:O-antigen ligase
MISLAFLWVLPRRYRFAAMVMPPLVIVLSILSFDNVAQRFAFTKAQITAYSGIWRQQHFVIHKSESDF